MSSAPAIAVHGLTHHYGQRAALRGIDFSVDRVEVFGLLGPNGSGKTTLFQVLSTLLPVQAGSIQVLGHDVRTEPSAVRARIGVTFQSPSVDGKLTVRENLMHQAHLYGVSGRRMRQRIDDRLECFGIANRANDRVESLSGGLKRRVEIAKGLLHQPQVLLLDEPSTGLDPGARIDLWRYLRQLQIDQHITVLVTTHLLDEAERCDRLGLLDCGRVVALGKPAELRASIGGNCLTIQSRQPDRLAQRIEDQFGVVPSRVGTSLRIEQERGQELLHQLVDAFPDEISSISLGKPTLEDVLIVQTGHRLEEDAVA